MITTEIGAISLTENQILNWVQSGIWKRFSYINGQVFAVSESQPSKTEIDSFAAQLSVLPDTDPRVQVKSARRNRKQAIRAKLGLTRQEVKHLQELIQDGDDD